MLECCVYWIRAKEHTDIFTEGYVGITNNFDYRISQHIGNCKNPKHYKNYRTAFRECVNSGNYVVSKVVIASREYCLELEGKLRPTWIVGWNIARGGNGGYGEHGLTGSKMAKAFYNMLTRAGLDGEGIHPEWLAADGLEIFKIFYDSVSEQEGVFTLKVRGLGYNPVNLVKLSRTEMLRKVRRSYDVGDGNTYCISELAEMSGMKPNTFLYRLRRGYTMDQALGKEERTYRSVSLDGKQYKYSGRLSDEQILEFKQDIGSGIPITHLTEKYQIDHGNLSRLAKRFEIEIPKIFIKDMFGQPFEVASHSKYRSETYEKIKVLLHTGMLYRDIATTLDVPVTCIYEVCKKLKWREYVKQQRALG